MILLYLIALFIAPQLWIEPFVDVRVDLFIYPIWFMLLILKGKINELFTFNKQDYFFIIFVIWLIISAMLNSKNQFTNEIIINYVKWFFLYRMVVLSIENNDDFISIIHKLIFIVYIIVIEAIQHKYSADGIGWAGQSLGWVDQSVIDAGGTGRTRWINIFDGPGVFCVMFTLILPFILQMQDKAFSRSAKILSLLLLIPLLLAIWTTGSRGGFLATLAIFASYSLSRMNISITRMLKIAGFLSVVFIMAPSHMTSVRDSNKSAQHRVEMWIEGIEMVQQNPVFGIGRGNFANYTGSLIAHNSAIEIMGELGLPGLFFWVGLIYMAFKTIFNSLQYEQEPTTKSYKKALTIVIIGYLANSMFVTLEYETFYFILALARSLDFEDKKRVVFEQKDFVRIGLIVLGFFAMIKIFVQIY